MSNRLIVECLFFLCLNCSRVIKNDIDNWVMDLFFIIGLVEEILFFLKESLLEFD